MAGLVWRTWAVLSRRVRACSFPVLLSLKMGRSLPVFELCRKGLKRLEQCHDAI